MVPQTHGWMILVYVNDDNDGAYKMNVNSPRMCIEIKCGTYEQQRERVTNPLYITHSAAWQRLECY